MFKSLTFKKFLPFALVLVVLASIIGSGLYFYNQQRNNTQDAKAADSNSLTLDSTKGALCPLVDVNGVAQHVCDKPLSLNLIVATSTSTDYNTWSPLSYSNNSQFTQWNCGKDNLFDGKKVLGIVDYEDGISSVVLKRTNTTREDNRNCFLENSLANNIDGNCTYINNLKTENDSLITRRCTPGLNYTFIPANNPVYAFQYRFEYNFTGDLKTKTLESDKFRSFTNKEGVYDGVVLTYTYYTYQETIPNCDGGGRADSCKRWKQWEVPTKDNKWGGWLIYGVGGSTNPGTNKEVTLNNLTGDPGSLQTGYTIKFNYVAPFNCPPTADCAPTGISYSGTLKNGGSNGCAALEQNQLVKENGKYVLKYKVGTKTIPNQICTQAFIDIPISGNLNVVLTDSEIANYNGLFEVKNISDSDSVSTEYKNLTYQQDPTKDSITGSNNLAEWFLKIKRTQDENGGCLTKSTIDGANRCAYIQLNPISCKTNPSNCSQDGGARIKDLSELYSYLKNINSIEKAQFLANATTTGYNYGVAQSSNGFVIKTKLDCVNTFQYFLIENKTNTYSLNKVLEYNEPGPAACS